MTRNVIKLIQMRKVDMKALKSQTDLYLMILLGNLDFHSRKNKGFTELEPPEDHGYLTDCLKIGQHALQNDSQQIKGFKKNKRMNNDSSTQCFKMKALGENVEIPIEFLLKLGIFDITTDGAEMTLNIIHLSYLEFLAAGSLLRPGVNIREELLKIMSVGRFKAVVMYMAG